MFFFLRRERLRAFLCLVSLFSVLISQTGFAGPETSLGGGLSNAVNAAGNPAETQAFDLTEPGGASKGAPNPGDPNAPAAAPEPSPSTDPTPAPNKLRRNCLLALGTGVVIVIAGAYFWFDGKTLRPQLSEKKPVVSRVDDNLQERADAFSLAVGPGLSTLVKTIHGEDPTFDERKMPVTLKFVPDGNEFRVVVEVKEFVIPSNERFAAKALVAGHSIDLTFDPTTKKIDDADVTVGATIRIQYDPQSSRVVVEEGHVTLRAVALGLTLKNKQYSLPVMQTDPLYLPLRAR